MQIKHWLLVLALGGVLAGCESTGMMGNADPVGTTIDDTDDNDADASYGGNVANDPG